MKILKLLPGLVPLLMCSGAFARTVDPGFWSHMGTGVQAGRSGLFTLDHADGRDLVVGQGFGYDPDFWTVFRHDSASGGYQQVHAHHPYLASGYSYLELHAVVDAEVDPRSGREIVVGAGVGFGHGVVYIYDGRTKELLRSFTPPYGPFDSDFDSLAAHDVDGDGSDELIIGGPSYLKVVAADGTLLWRTGSLGERLKVGQLDDDLSLEVAGSNGKVLDLESRSVQWGMMGNESYTDVIIRDVDGDGVGNLLSFKKFGGVFALDIRTGEELWRYERPGGISAVLVADLDADGIDELGVADAQWGGLHVLRMGQGTPVELYAIDEPGYDPERGHTDSGTYGLLLADPDSDGTNELVWCYGGSGSTGSRTRIFIYDPIARVFEWASPWRSGPNGTPKIGDVTGDGIPEIVTSAFPSNVAVFDSETLNQIGYSGEITADSGLFYPTVVDLVDIDGDGCMEIATATGIHVRIFKFREGGEFEEIWRAMDPPVSRSPDFEREHQGLENVFVRDVDGDGALEVVVTTNGMAADALSDFVQVFDLNTRRRKWVSGEVLPMFEGFPGGSKSVRSSLVKDIDDDGHLEIVITLSYGPLAVLDLATGELELYDEESQYSVLSDLPQGNVFLALEVERQPNNWISGWLQKFTLGPGGYERELEKVLGTWESEALAIMPAPLERWWVITRSRVYLIDAQGHSDWASERMESIRGGFAFLETGDGPELYVGWQHGIAGFKVGHLFQKPEIRVDTMVTPVESGRQGYVRFSRKDAGVGPSRIRFTFSGTAKLGEDFTLAGAFDEDGDGVWEFELNDSSERGVTFYPVGDNLAEGSESVVLQMLDDPSFVYAEPGPVEFFIEDDEPRLSVSVLKGEASESAKGVLEFLVERTGNLAVPLAADFRIGGTADSKDFAALDRALQFKAGMGSLKLRFTAKADKVAEPAESVTVELDGGASAWVNPAAGTSTGWILDAQPTVRLAGTKSVHGGIEVLLATEGGAANRNAVKLELQSELSDGKASRKVVTVKVGTGPEAGRHLVKSGKSGARVTITLLNDPAYHRSGEEQLVFDLPAINR